MGGSATSTIARPWGLRGRPASGRTPRLLGMEQDDVVGQRGGVRQHLEVLALEPARPVEQQRVRTQVADAVGHQQSADALGVGLRDLHLVEEALLARLHETLELLEDNTAEVQALDSGSQVAAVFSTEAHGVTVIWVPEPEESGT